MKFIAEDTIDTIIEKLETNTEFYEETLSYHSGTQEPLFHFLSLDNFKLLLSEEYDLLLFMALVVLESCKEEEGTLKKVAIPTIEETEEKLWALFTETKAKSFKTKIDPFFAANHQEDLLAFVEDTLIIEEDSFLTGPGREIIFVSMATLVFALDTENNTA